MVGIVVAVVGVDVVAVTIFIDINHWVISHLGPGHLNRGLSLLVHIQPCHGPITTGPHNKIILLASRPQQSYTTSVALSLNFAPTDIDQALHTMTLNSPDDNWYMDTGATSHMTGSTGIPGGETTNEM